MPSPHRPGPPRSSLLHRLRTRGVWATLVALLVDERTRSPRRQLGPALDDREARNGLAVIEQSVPVVEQSVPVIEQSVPVIEQSVPVVEQSVPVVEQSVPVVEPPIADPPLAEPSAPLAEPPRSSLLHRICARGAWAWLVALLTVVAAAVGQLAANDTKDTYVSTGSYVVRPRATDDVTSIQAAASLSGASRVDTTFARIVESRLILDRAWEAVRSGGSDAKADAAEVVATVTPSTNILSISVRTEDAVTTSALAAAVGAEAIRYVQSIDLYNLSVLDPPSVPRRVSQVPLQPRTLLAAGLVGLGVGAATTPLARRRSSRVRKVSASNVLDTGVSNEWYTRQRIREERSRSDDNGVPFHLIAVHTNVPRRRAASRLLLRSERRDVSAMARAMSSALKDEDRLGYLREHATGTFVAIAPGRTNEQADELAGRLRAAATALRGRYRGQRVVATSHTCTYDGTVFHGDPEAVRIADAL